MLNSFTYINNYTNEFTRTRSNICPKLSIYRVVQSSSVALSDSLINALISLSQNLGLEKLFDI